MCTWNLRRGKNENGTEALLKEIMPESFPYLWKCTNLQSLEVQQTHAGEIQKYIYIGIEILNIKKNLKTAIEQKHIQGKNKKNDGWLLIETMEAREQ